MGAGLGREFCTGGLPDGPGPQARPSSAEGTFLRIVMVNDVYKLDNYPRVRAAIEQTKAASSSSDCVVLTMLPGDFLSPCTISSLDGGVAMMRGVSEAGIDIVMFGNHEFDLKPEPLQQRIKEFPGTWINSNVTKPAFIGSDGKPLPEYLLVQVGKRKVAVAAYLLDDLNQFSPLNCPAVTKPSEAVVHTWDAIVEKHGAVDAFVPMTHLNIKQDREFAESIAKHPELKKVTPVTLGGHDHEVYIEQAGASLIFKIGCDAENIGIVDLWWNSSGTLQRSVHMFASSDFTPDPLCQAFVDKKLHLLSEMTQTPILDLPSDGSRWASTRVRFEEEPLVSLLLKLVKDDTGVDLVMVQGGNVRGNTTYKPGPWTYGDLMAEFAFDTQMAVVDLPGDVIEQTIVNSRTKPEGAKPFFLHCDSDAAFSKGPSMTLDKIDGKPLDRSRMYKVATYQFLLGGMGDMQPMFNYMTEKGNVPSLETCMGIKHYIMRRLMHRAWRTILSDGAELGAAAVQQRAKEFFKVADKNGDGQVDPTELEDILSKRGNGAEKRLVKFLIDALDQNSDGKLSMSELCAIAS